ncbi:Hsp70 family protein-like protein [Xylogone sp. PMI_703]|nr:Hsp70 family protein-like protein [Xylogone sp. PMI_703]
MAPYVRESSQTSDSTLRQESEALPDPRKRTTRISRQAKLPKSKKSNDEHAQTRFIVATDFGTTFSSVAFTKIQGDKASEIMSIVNWPHDPTISGVKSLQVPSESWYYAGDYNDAYEEDSMDTESSDVSDAYAPLHFLYDDDDDDDGLGFSLPNNQTTRGTEEPGDPSQQGGIPLSQESSIWGYGIQTRQLSPANERAEFVPISMSKLLLDKSEHTQSFRHGLLMPLKRLKQAGIIRKDEDVISSYLSHLFRHTKEQLTSLYGLNDSCIVEHVLCVPNAWSPEALRIMQECIQAAIQASELGSMDNLFIVSEPEAAAMFVLERTQLVNAAETFMIIDAGGGTVDLTTYSVERKSPLRLTKEVVEASGGCYGSSFLNISFRKYLEDKLAEESYLDDETYTIKRRIDEIMVQFENQIKRTIDLSSPDIKTSIRITGLRQNRKKGFERNELILRHADYLKIFNPVLRGITRLIREQLRRAQKAGQLIQKVILIGGFGASPTLRAHLNDKLEDWNNNEECYKEAEIQLVNPIAPENAVALGAAMRALNKEHGPARIIGSSYGFLRTEPYEPHELEEHRGPVKPWVDPCDGLEYVRNTIDWLIPKGKTIKAQDEFPIISYHLFPIDAEYFICEELLYVSDVAKKSHYKRSHPNNRKVSTIAGRIEVDMTFLRDEGYIFPKYPEPGRRGRPHYKVEFELLMIVNGRSLRYEARYPVGGPIRGHGEICIAAAFRPGTE